MEGTPVTRNIAVSKKENKRENIQIVSRLSLGNRQEKSRARGMRTSRQGTVLMRMDNIQDIKIPHFQNKIPLKVYILQVTTFLI